MEFKGNYKHVNRLYHARSVELEAFSERILRFLPIGIPDFPSHGYDHSVNIIDYINDFIDNWISDLNEEEIFLLYASALTHDFGCFFGRDKHNEKSIIIIEKLPYFQALLDDRIINCLKYVVISHSSSYDINQVPVSWSGIRLRLISAIFRLMDACEICTTKCPSEVYELIQMSKYPLNRTADQYWKAHMNIHNVSLRYPPKIIVSLNDKDGSSIIIEDLNREIDSIKSVFSLNNIPIPEIEKDFLPWK